MAYTFDRAKESLTTIAVLKQDVYEHSFKVFEHLKKTSKSLSNCLDEEVYKVDPRVHVEYKDVNRNEFWLRFGGDVLIFSLHSNVFSFDKEHSLFSSKYISEDTSRAYFCMIEVFNFLHDSVEYNRMRDVGEMTCRIFINKENKFFIEGMGAIGSMFGDLENQVFDQNAMNQILESSITTCIEYDLWAPPFNDVRYIPFQAIIEKNGDSPRSTSKRLGFEIKS